MQTESPEAEPPKRKRRWFQFSLRTMLSIVTILAGVSAWLGAIWHAKLEQRIGLGQALIAAATIAIGSRPLYRVGSLMNTNSPRPRSVVRDTSAPDAVIIAKSESVSSKPPLYISFHSFS